MSEKHTQGRLHSEANHLVVGSVRIAVVDTPDIHAGVDYYESEANARRLVACWNACDGLSTDALEKLYIGEESLPHTISVLKNQRDELLEALEVCRDALQRIRESGGQRATAEIVAEQAIAKVKGGAA